MLRSAQIVIILQETFSYAFSWMEIIDFSKISLTFLAGVQLAIGSDSGLAPNTIDISSDNGMALNRRPAIIWANGASEPMIRLVYLTHICNIRHQLVNPRDIYFTSLGIITINHYFFCEKSTSDDLTAIRCGLYYNDFLEYWNLSVHLKPVIFTLTHRFMPEHVLGCFLRYVVGDASGLCWYGVRHH